MFVNDLNFYYIRHPILNNIEIQREKKKEVYLTSINTSKTSLNKFVLNDVKNQSKKQSKSLKLRSPLNLYKNLPKRQNKISPT